MYVKGEGVLQDYKEGIKWNLKAAEQGLADAQFNLGIMYANGDGVPEDDTEAVRWYRKAAKQGHANAQFNLGTMYTKGDGVPKDYATACKWCWLAAVQGNERAKKLRSVLFEYMDKEQIKESFKLSREWMANRQE